MKGVLTRRRPRKTRLDARSRDRVQSSKSPRSELGVAVLVSDALPSSAPHIRRPRPPAVKVCDTTVPLRVHGDRVFYRGATGIVIGPAARFERKPITSERAYGGTASDRWIVESRNPAGVGVAAEAKDLIDKPADRIEWEKLYRRYSASLERAKK